MSDSLYSLRAKAGAHTKWANCGDRPAATAAARKVANEERFERQARELYGDLPADELARRAGHLRKAHMAKMALASAKARRRKAAAT